MSEEIDEKTCMEDDADGWTLYRCLREKMGIESCMH